MSFLKKEKFALEIRSKIRENTFFQKRSNFKECSDKKLPEEIKKNEENVISLIFLNIF